MGRWETIIVCYIGKLLEIRDRLACQWCDGLAAVLTLCRAFFILYYTVLYSILHTVNIIPSGSVTYHTVITAVVPDNRTVTTYMLQ